MVRSANALFDLGSFYFTAKHSPEPITIKYFHVDNKTMYHFWDRFVFYYFGTDKLEEVAQIEKELAPYAALRLLYICSNADPKEPLDDRIFEIIKRFIPQES